RRSAVPAVAAQPGRYAAYGRSGAPGGEPAADDPAPEQPTARHVVAYIPYRRRLVWRPDDPDQPAVRPDLSHTGPRPGAEPGRFSSLLSAAWLYPDRLSGASLCPFAPTHAHGRPGGCGRLPEFVGGAGRGRAAASATPQPGRTPPDA